jgi:aminoglycoside phosphotransferase (APT) family kinase protein
LLVRRATGGAIYSEMLSLEEEFRVLEAAFEADVKVPKPYGYLDNVGGREAFVMDLVKGETIGRRIVQQPELAAARDALPAQMATELARIHSIPLGRVDFLPGPREPPAAPPYLDALEEELDALHEPHPAIELGLRWLRDHPPPSRSVVFVHGDFRLGNLVVDQSGLVAVLDWENTHTGDPAEDLGWSLVRAWRFSADHHRLAGVSEAGPYLEHYNALTKRGITLDELFYWELAGNVRWAIGALNQARRHLSGAEPSVELAILGRLASEVEYEVVSLLESAG